MPTPNHQENRYSINNNDSSKINSSLKSCIVPKNKYLKNSPQIKSEENTMIYQKTKLFENSIKRDKKIVYLNNRKPMTTKRITKKKINYMERNITPKRDINFIGNKSENIKAMNDKYINSMRDKDIYKSGNGYLSVNREKKIKKPIETSPGGNNKDMKYLNIIKKKNYSKKIQNEIIQRSQSAIPIKKNTKLNNFANNYDKNITELNLDIENNIKNNYLKNISNNDFMNNGEDRINVLINKYNKKNINFNSYNPNNRIIVERPSTTTNSNKYNNNPLGIPPKKIIKNQTNKMLSRDKNNLNKKRIVNKNLIERDMTEPELLKMINPIKVGGIKKDYQKNINISLNTPEQNAFLHHKKANKMIRFNNNNNPKYNQYYTNNIEQNNPQIFNNFVSINNLVTPGFLVELLNAFGQK